MKTKFDEIEFNKEWHTYRLKGKQLTNVTKLVSSVKIPFDRDGQAAKSAVKMSLPVAEVLAMWDKTAEEGRARGSKVHAHIEWALRGLQPAGDPFLALNERLPEMDAFDALWGKLKERVKPLEAGGWMPAMMNTAGRCFWATARRRSR